MKAVSSELGLKSARRTLPSEAPTACCHDPGGPLPRRCLKVVPSYTSRIAVSSAHAGSAPCAVYTHIPLISI